MIDCPSPLRGEGQGEGFLDFVRVIVVLGFLSATSCSRGRDTDVRSTTFPVPKERTSVLCAYVICPTPPEDAAFHVVIEQRPSLLGTDTRKDIQAVVKVAPDDVARWRKTCTPRRLDRPPWLEPMLAERGWQATTIPDSYVCGQEQRLVHVREGLVVLWAKSDST